MPFSLEFAVRLSLRQPSRQRQRLHRAGSVLLALAWALLLGAALVGPPTGAGQTRATVYLALAFYALACGLMLRLDRPGWCAATPLGRLARAAWALGLASFLVHVGLAFHHHHDWSHAEAMRHVEQASGFGPGIFLSYLFTLLWALDAVWWCAWPQSYANRPAAAGRCLHGFLLFMAFNATVVFESGLIRWAGLVGFLVLGVLALVRPAPSLGELS
jgi:hypothetical protein